MWVSVIKLDSSLHDFHIRTLFETQKFWYLHIILLAHPVKSNPIKNSWLHPWRDMCRSQYPKGRQTVLLVKEISSNNSKSKLYNTKISINHINLKWVSRTVAQANNHISKIQHPYFHWYFYQNTSVCMFQASLCKF